MRTIDNLVNSRGKFSQNVIFQNSFQFHLTFAKILWHLFNTLRYLSIYTKRLVFGRIMILLILRKQALSLHAVTMNNQLYSSKSFYPI